MKHLIAITLLTVLTIGVSYGQKYKTTTGNVKFFSETPIEDIEAKSSKLACILNTKTNQVFFAVKMTSFQFDKEKMREHFNENYVESDKYPNGTFKGKIQEDIDYSVDTTYNVTVKGTFTVHGVAKERTMKGTVTIKDGKISLHSVFNVKVADHKIKIPKAVFYNIAEEMKVTVDATLTEVKE